MEDARKKKVVAYWLLAGVFMIIIQTLLGGITRLTGSGLSITKWDPLFGILPPLNQKQWEEAFNGYKQIGQFIYENSYYSLADFKHLFFWEWLHRFWARMLGIVFAIGFIFFLIRGYFDKKMIKPFIILFLLGGLQGVIGWLMVASGVNTEDVHVNYTWLAAHFLAAMVLACYTLWFALQILVPEGKKVYNKRLHNFTMIVLIVLVIQLMYGAFMAGLKAANVAATWPDINGSYIPATLTTNGILHDANLHALQLNVHFMHRTIAYTLFILITIWFAMAVRYKGNTLFSRTRLWPFILVLLQVTLGIITVLTSPLIVHGKFGTFETLAELHQLVAMFLLMALVVNLYIIRRTRQI